MKNSKKKALAVMTLVSIVMSAFAGCSGKKEESKGSLADEKKRTPFHYGADVSSIDSDPYNLNGTDPSKDNSSAESSGSEGSSSEPVTEYQPVTDADGEPVTTYVPVTDASGEKVTDTNGSIVTTAQTVTTVVTKNPVISNDDPSSYVPNTKTAYAMWLDISKVDEGFMFEDSFIKVTFKIKDDIPDGVYEVKVADPDFSSIMGQPIDPDKVIDGKIFVNTSSEKEPDISSESGLVVSGDYVSCKQGDEVTFCFNIKNNPGLAAMMFLFDYDGNAMEILDCVADGEFAEFADATMGSKKDKK